MPWDHNHQKIFYFKSISCCDQTARAIAHFIKLWLGFRSLWPFTIYSLPLSSLSDDVRNPLELSTGPVSQSSIFFHTGPLLFAAWIFMGTKSLAMLLSRLQDDTKVVPSVRWIHNGMAWEHKSWLLGLYLTSLNCPALWHKSLLWIAIISPLPLDRSDWLSVQMWARALKANQCPVSFGCWVAMVALNINPVLSIALLPLLANTGYIQLNTRAGPQRGIKHFHGAKRIE